MTAFENSIAEAVERQGSQAGPPRIDLDAVRRAGRRRARTRTALVAAGLALVVGGGYAVADTRLGDSAGDDVQPAGLPTMSFDAGLRAWFDPDDGSVHMGGEVFDIGNVPGLDTSASATPYGLVFFGEDQDVRLLRASGDVDVLAPGVGPAGEFGPTVKFDALEPLVAWLTRSSGEVTLTVHRLGADAGTVGTWPVPCEGGDCEGVALAGVDQGLVFVRGDGGTAVLDPSEGEDASWSTVTERRVADVRNRVLLVEGEPPSTPPAGGPLAGSWRFAVAQGPESLLTFDGGHELYWSSTLPSTVPGERPLVLPLPPGRGTEFVNLDSDGSVLVVRAGQERQTWYDCPVPDGPCEEFARSQIQSGDPGFIGNDM